VTAPRRLACLLVAGLILVAAGSASAHPHIHVVYSMVLPLGPQGVEGVGFVFTFDVLFSAILLRDAGEGDPESSARSHARMLRQIPFEIEIAYNGMPVALDPPADLRVTTAGGHVTYRFIVPLRSILRPPGTIDISVDDPGVFAAFVLRSPDSVDVQASGPFTAVCDRARTSTGAPGPVRCEYAATEP
jgi:ABC-type uncharacterized transport system substrate-binding protein